VFAALTLLSLVLLGLPGALLGDRLASGRPAFERRALALACGLACGVVLTYLCTLAGAHLVSAIVLGLLAVALLVWRLRDPPLAPSSTGGMDLVGPAVILLATLWFALPVLRQPMPQGWDPAFHTPLIELIRAQGRVPATWAPYEPADRFNYPSGLHAYVALAARLGGASSELAFSLAFALAAALALAVVYALGRRFGGGVAAGVLAVALFGFTEGWGTPTSHAAWGGLPSLAGLALMGAFVLAVSRPGKGAILLAALFASAAAFLHHLSFFLLGFTVALTVALELVSERRWSPQARAAFIAMALASVTAGALVMLNPNGRYDTGQALRFEGEHILVLSKIVEVMGAPMLVFGLAGLALVLFTHREKEQRLLPAFAIGLIGFWASFDLLYRGAVYWINHENYTAFTPSRGLTDAAMPLAVCGAILLERLCARLPVPRVAAAIVALAIAALGGRAELARIREAQVFTGAFAEARALCQEVRRVTPVQAVIFAPNAGEVGIWLPYLCEREFNYFPEPTYGMSPYRQRKADARDPSQFAGVVAGREVFWAMRGRAELPVAASAGGWNLYRVTP
jgi:hypothetical protein